LGRGAVVRVARRRSTFRLGEWVRAARPFTCRCGHARSHHASGRGLCARCTCPAPVRATRWSLLAIGYRLGFEAGRRFREDRPLVVQDFLAQCPTVALDQQAPVELVDDPYAGWSFSWTPEGEVDVWRHDEEDR
jgi:hypothetical protein